MDLVIQVYTNKQMLVGVYLYKGRVSDDTPESAETVILETPRRHFKKCTQTNEQQLVKVTAAL